MPQWWLRRILLGASRTLSKFKRTQNSVPRRRRDLIPWAPARKDRSGNVNTFFQFMKSVKKGSQSFPPSELRRPRCIERWKLLWSKKKIRTCCLSYHFIKVPRCRRRTFPVKTLNQFLPKTHHEFLPHFPIRAKQDKTNTEAIDISIHSNESPSIVSTVRLSFSETIAHEVHLFLIDPSSPQR